MILYEFRQNNSGGSFKFDADHGISIVVVIEATSREDAVQRAENIGLYFDGEGDCDCCGNRWYDHPEIVETPGVNDFHRSYCSAGVPPGYVHYLNGRVKALR